MDASTGCGNAHTKCGKKRPGVCQFKIFSAAIFDRQFAELLISNGASVNVLTKNYRFDGFYWRPIHLASHLGNKELVELLISKGVDINTKTGGEETPLHYAAIFDQKEIIELLIENRDDVNTMDDEGDTPLDSAIFNGNPEIADLLRKHGAKTGKELKAEGK